jgi:hypothetical protein
MLSFFKLRLYSLTFIIDGLETILNAILGNFFFRRIIIVYGKLPQTIQSRQVYMVVSGLYVLRQPA